jgi:hypothetical protein
MSQENVEIVRRAVVASTAKPPDLATSMGSITATTS